MKGAPAGGKAPPRRAPSRGRPVLGFPLPKLGQSSRLLVPASNSAPPLAQFVGSEPHLTGLPPVLPDFSGCPLDGLQCVVVLGGGMADGPALAAGSPRLG